MQPWSAMWLGCLTLALTFGTSCAASPMLRLSYLQDSPMAQSSLDSWITEDTVENVTSLSCYDFDDSCQWESITSHNVSLKWFRSSGYLDPYYFGPITNTTSLPTGFYAVAAYDSATDPKMSAVLSSASAVCPGGLQNFNLSYWLSPGVVLKLCIMLSVKSYPNFDFCQNMDRSLSPGPVTIYTPSLGNNSFQIFLIATNFSYTSDKFVGGFAVIDNITFSDNSCIMTPVMADPTGSSSIVLKAAPTTMGPIMITGGGILSLGSSGGTGTVVTLGTTNAPGVTGSMGSSGPTNASSVSGATGSMTSANTTSATGSVGATGSMTSSNTTSASGVPGGTGSMAPSGTTSATGVSGAMGSMVSSGTTGATAVSGATGSMTSSNTTNATNSGNPTGSPVSSGATSAVGATGATGAMVPSGTISGASVTTGATMSTTIVTGVAGSTVPSNATKATSAAGPLGGASLTSSNTTSAISGANPTGSPVSPGATSGSNVVGVTGATTSAGMTSAPNGASTTGLMAPSGTTSATGVSGAGASTGAMTPSGTISGASVTTGATMSTTIVTGVTGSTVSSNATKATSAAGPLGGASLTNVTVGPMLLFSSNTTASVVPPIVALGTALNSTLPPLTNIPAVSIIPTLSTPMDPGRIILSTIPVSELGSFVAIPNNIIQRDAVNNNPMLATGLPANLLNLSSILNAGPTVDPGRVVLSTISMNQLPFYTAGPGLPVSQSAVTGNPMPGAPLPTNLINLLNPVGGVSLITNSSSLGLNSSISSASSSSNSSSSSSTASLTSPSLSVLSPTLPYTVSTATTNILLTTPTTVPPTTLDPNATAAAAAARAARQAACSSVTCDFQPTSKFSCAQPLNYTRWSSTTSPISAANGTTISPSPGTAMAYIAGPMPWSRLVIGPGTFDQAITFFYQYKVSLQQTTKAVFDVYLKRSDFFIETLMAAPIMTLPANPTAWNNITEFIFPGTIEYIAFEVRNLAANEVVAVNATGLLPTFNYDYCA